MIGLYDTTDKQIGKIANNARDYWKENGSKGPIGPYVKRAVNEYSRRLSRKEYSRIYRKVCRILGSRNKTKKAEQPSPLPKTEQKQLKDQSSQQAAVKQPELAGIIIDIPKQYH